MHEAMFVVVSVATNGSSVACNVNEEYSPKMFFLLNCKLYKIKILEVIDIFVQFHCFSS